MMEGEEFHISLTTDARPFCINTPRSIPIAYRDKLKSELDLLLSQKVITPVVTPKKGTDRIRMHVDLSHFNKYVLQEGYQSLTPAQTVADIAANEAKIFTVLDALKGYHQYPLDQESQMLTTFITPFGRFKYLRAPYGICSISEHYNRRMAEAFTGLSGFRHVVDDIVIYDSNVEDHIAHGKQFLQRCADKNIALNIDKCKLKPPLLASNCQHMGIRLMNQSLRQSPSTQTPTSCTDLRLFIGLVNQLSNSTNTVYSNPPSSP